MTKTATIINMEVHIIIAVSLVENISNIVFLFNGFDRPHANHVIISASCPAALVQ